MYGGASIQVSTEKLRRKRLGLPDENFAEAFQTSGVSSGLGPKMESGTPPMIRAPRAEDAYGGTIRGAIRDSRIRSLMETDIDRMDFAGPFQSQFRQAIRGRRSSDPTRQSMSLGHLGPLNVPFTPSPRA